MTLDEITRLFAGYPNNNNKVAHEVAESIFNAQISAGVFIPMSGTAENTYVSGNVNLEIVKGFTWFDITDPENPVEKVTMQSTSSKFVVGANDSTVSAEFDNFFSMAFNSSDLYFGVDGGKIGFLGADSVVKQIVDNSALNNPAGGATVDSQARTAIDTLNDVVRSMRSAMYLYGLVEPA